MPTLTASTPATNQPRTCRPRSLRAVRNRLWGLGLLGVGLLLVGLGVGTVLLLNHAELAWGQRWADWVPPDLIAEAAGPGAAFLVVGLYQIATGREVLLAGIFKSEWGGRNAVIFACFLLAGGLSGWAAGLLYREPNGDLSGWIVWGMALGLTGGLFREMHRLSRA